LAGTFELSLPQLLEEFDSGTVRILSARRG